MDLAVREDRGRMEDVGKRLDVQVARLGESRKGSGALRRRDHSLLILRFAQDELRSS